MFAQSNTATAETQSEVDRLLASVGGNDTLGSGLGQHSEGGHDLAPRYDFPQSTVCSADEMRKLRAQCEAFVNTLAARLSIHLRMECSLQMTKLETVRFQNFVEGMASPTFLTLFRLEPLASACLLEIPARLALAVVDRELGGPAACPEETRDLTLIEAKLSGRVAQIVLNEWCNAWTAVLPLRPAIIGHENSGRFLNTCAPHTKLLVLGLEMRIGQCAETIQLALPPAIQKPLIAKLSVESPSLEPSPGAPSASGAKWNPALNDLNLHVTARWHGLEISARQLADLKPGDFLPLRPAIASQVEVALDKAPKFTGQLGIVGQRWAVKILDRVK